MGNPAGWELRVRMAGGAPAASVLARGTGEVRLVELGASGGPPRVGVVLIGYAESAARRIGDAPALCVGGQVDVTGDELSLWDAAGLEAGIAGFVSEHGVDAAVVSGMNSPMNPAHEAGAARLCRERAALPALEARFLGAELNAVERVRQGIAAMRGLMLLRALAAEIRRGDQGHGGQAAIRIVGVETKWAGAWVACDLLAGWGAEPAVDALTVSARITRLADKSYGCHCDDRRYAFDSLLEAKRFAEAHLEATVRERMRRCGLTVASVEVQAEDRFAHGKGRKGPMRVFLESHVRAAARAAAEPAEP